MSVTLNVGTLRVNPEKLTRALNAGLPPERMLDLFKKEADASQSYKEIRSLVRKGAIKRLTQPRSEVEIYLVKKRLVRRFAEAVESQAHRRLDELDCEFLNHFVWLVELLCYLRGVQEDIYIFG